MKVIIFILGCLLCIKEGALAATSTSPQLPQTHPKKIVVGAEDTVYGIAYNYGLPTRAIIAANNLKPPYILKKGDVIVIPSPNEHFVGKEETLQSIAEDYGVNVDVLAQENNIDSPDRVTPGSNLAIPARDTEPLNEALKPPSHEITTSSLAPLPLVKTLPAPNKAKQPETLSQDENLPKTSKGALFEELAEELAREKGTEKKGKETTDASLKPMVMGNLAQRNAGAPITPDEPFQEEVVEEKKPKKTAKKEQKKKPTEKKEVSKAAAFIWPAEGKVINKFNANGKNDGINIKLPEGTSIKASAAGEVMYAGSELKGFGNLLLLKHKDGWMTAYAHNSELLVKKGDQVEQGQVIAKSGKTGDVKEPQLHFEIRKGKQPVDPLPKLES